jgi:hypothetical protein
MPKPTEAGDVGPALEETGFDSYGSQHRPLFAHELLVEQETRAGIAIDVDGVDPLFLFTPALQAGPPAAHIVAIHLVVSAKPPAECRFFVEDYEQMHAKSNRCDSSNRRQAGMPEYNPQPDPAYGKAHVHGIAHVAIKTHDY